ncbi:antibiotic biosynthesis monooxygenase family protein [Thalassobius sp. S69A]|uniref:antibiotic biosynthesis monooxygenase family protein n=1 Tax=unclassified Thalassovita TaxID=2619711 RepID=UPI000C120D20|nr:antibiotic biosynthesis monooxygenase [Paracoccaceae bacterium]MBT26283.1 antibiotic biosynthesis monooxygenase [Paracoccaceae bacterium]
MSYIAMNRFRVVPGGEEQFETIWRERESHLKKLPGFVEFRVLKGPEKDGYRLYSSHTLWKTEEDFQAWTRSEEFRAAHKNAGNRGTKDLLMGPPEFEGFQTVLHETL